MIGEEKDDFSLNFFEDGEEDIFSVWQQGEAEDAYQLFQEDEDQEVDETANPYLKDADKGLELISSLLKVSKEMQWQKRKVEKLDHLIDRKLLQSISKLNLKNEVELYKQLVQLSDKLFEQNKLKLLQNKSVIGIGGQFSAGKSKFINSIFNIDILPEDQVPTTSIATYIMKGDVLNVQANTKFDRNVELSMDAVKALSHEFYKKYQLGFSQFINNLVITIPSFPYDCIAFLDTPGYSKNDNAVKKSISDEQKAYEQLKTVDFLIWLIDVENGVIKQRDIEFIEALNIKNPILIVFNKADKKPLDEVKSIVDHTQEQLKQHQIPIYEVIAYSAQEQKEYFETDYLNTFLEEVNARSRKQMSIQSEISQVMKQLKQLIEMKRNRLIEERNKIGDIIFRSQNVFEIRTLTELYSVILLDIKEIEYCARNLQKKEKEIHSLLQSLDI